MYISYWDYSVLESKKIKSFSIDRNYIYVDGKPLESKSGGMIHQSQLIAVSVDKP